MNIEKLRSIYYSMKTRCNDTKHRDFKWYGARGIKCLFYTFESFCLWASTNGYGEGLQIDRINSDGHYAPENCRWITSKANNNNKRNNISVEYKGETRTLTEWCEIAGVDRQVMYKRIARYRWTPEMVVKSFMEDICS